ncbi:hypothetical protein SAMD00019534_009320 [Acytostelium subglobosum LB1]|uniref:hypothetical protein n=1 Tax=Acytostelium subglobosum LB1 TaxID=1410327 RepID=UPI000644EEAE|nr:hypothetical protein SAMD00019534_009320 [Acytostelium subglobosum LB1]GAM17757.1 hypothetical protein SAMD00019534_009320 [Acytostelium subglobosum LB1]|eukprot:XP_012758353.1 hypothetical protein SAMD00019534_009320 [Acytostelium subglobosum LB1]
MLDLNRKTGEDMYVNRHSNGLCVVGLAPTHPALAKKITRFEYTNVIANNSVQGTQKKGGTTLHKDTVVARLTCDDGTVYDLYSCIKGKLLETNKYLSTDVTSLQTQAGTNGYLLIAEPFERVDYMAKNSDLLSFDQYHHTRNIPIDKGPKFLKDMGDDEEATAAGGGN